MIRPSASRNQCDWVMAKGLPVGGKLREIPTDRLRLYRDAGINTLRANLGGGPTVDDLDGRLDDLGRLLDLVQHINAESPTPRTSNA